jgi:hypothetical protein
MKATRKINLVVIGVLVAIFCFRLLMGFSKFSSHDEFQIYLIGLQSYTNNLYPYFGPDVVYTQTQIPGGLQGLLVATPLWLFEAPESPYYLLNLLSFGALLFFGWYLSERLQNVPKWFVYSWVFTCPWALQFSTHIENPSYVLVGAILFWVAVFDLGKFYEKKLLNSNLSFTFLGFALLWIFQLHLSWVLMPPIILWVFWENRKDRKLLSFGWKYFLIGVVMSGSTFMPTLLKNFGGASNVRLLL